jgi:hypothetical protein
MSQNTSSSEDIRLKIDKLLESIRTEREEQPMHMMSSADIRSLNHKVGQLQQLLVELQTRFDPNASQAD